CQQKLGSYAKKHKIWIPVATQAGRTSDEDFPGGGYLFSPEGECLFSTPNWETGVVFLEIDMESKQIKIL
ncbi:MAG: hypothetical protein ACFFD1_11075, partial [Candidatus Thorarchaeota archaeon]